MSIDKLSLEAKTLYFNLGNKYIDIISIAVFCRLTPNEIQKAFKELQDLNLIETKTLIKKK